MRINTNINAMTALNQSTKNTALAGASMGKLSSGERINKAGDDAAGLAISEKMRAQIRGLDQASRNAQDGVSVVQTAEGAMDEIGNITQRMRELSVQAANETNSVEDREKITTELKQLHSEIDRIADSTEFNGKTLLRGTSGTSGTSVTSSTDATVSTDLKGVTVTAIGAFVGETGNATIEVDTINKEIKLTLQSGTELTGTLNEDKDTITFDSGDGNKIDIKLDNSLTEDDLTAAIASGELNELNNGTITITEGTSGGGGTTTPPTTGTAGKLEINLQIGANTGIGQNLTIEIDDVSTTGLGLTLDDITALEDADLSEGTKAANNLTDKLDEALKNVNNSRAKLGAYQNRLESAQSNLTTSSENLTAAESRIRDVDVAKEMMNLSKLNLLNQASQAMMMQAKSQPEGVMQLLR